LISRLGDDKAVASLGGPEATAEISTWFVGQWGGREPATYNRNLDALRSAAGYWADEGWINGDRTANLRRRPVQQTASERSCGPRLMSCSPAVAWLCERRPLWRLLCETAARASEVLGLDVDDLDLRNRRARVRRKGGAVDIIVWQTGSARLLPRLLEGRRTGPVFLTDRRARVPLAPGDVDPSSGKARLSYRRAAELFEAATKGATLHQLRHSALTDAAEAGANTSTLLAYSGHTSASWWFSRGDLL